jgi:hypothetical protein
MNSTQPIRWEKVFIFISSTFNDMHAERDYLVKRVFPELQDWCERRRLRLVDIDLRWGVTEQDATHNKNVVKVCLSRIDDCRPFFLCFLGQRRGWVPKETEVSPETFDAFPDLRRVVGAASVTELEILHALINPFHQGLSRDASKPIEYYERAKHAFFYLRDPSYLGQLPSDPPMLRETYTNEWVEDPAEREGQNLALNEWRDREIPNAGRPFHFYQAEWDPNGQTPELSLPLQCPSTEPANLERWRRQWSKAGVDATSLNIEADQAEAIKAKQFNSRLSAGRLTNFTCQGTPLSGIIIRELQEAIAARFPNHREAVEQEGLQKEIDQQERFLFVNSEGFIERAGDFDELDRYAENESNKLFALSAPGGVGKTMLLANWVDGYRKRIEAGGGNESIHFRFIGASDRSTSVHSLLRFLLREMKEVAGRFEGEIPGDPIKLRQTWLDSLSHAGRHGKTVIVIDALNQLESGLTDLNWLPLLLPENIKLIVSFKRDEKAEELFRRWREAQVNLSEVKPFDNLDDRRRLVKAYLSQYLKELDEEHLEALINLAGAGNPLYLKVVLSELRVFGAFGGLAAKIRSDFGDTPITAFEALLKRLETDPAYSAVEPKRVVPLLFSLLAHARHGLSADELTDLAIQALALEQDDQSREAAADAINLFLRQVRPFLAHREGRYDFFYESFKLAAQQRYVATHADYDLPRRPAHEWHRHLAEYFRRRTDPTGDRRWSGHYPRGLTELPYHSLEGQLPGEP